MEFYNWLLKQQDRQDAIGLFARALADVDKKRLKKKRRGRRKNDPHKKWADIVTRRDNPRLTMAFNDAWQEFTAYQQEHAPAS